MLEAKVNDPAINKVAFAMNRVGSKALLPNVDATPAGAPGMWEAPFDTSVIDNAKYDIVAYGQRADKTMVKSATITMTIHNPVFRMTPATVSAGRNVQLHLQYAPQHEDAKGIATAYQCVGTDPVTDEDLAPAATRQAPRTPSRSPVSRCRSRSGRSSRTRKPGTPSTAHLTSRRPSRSRIW